MTTPLPIDPALLEAAHKAFRQDDSAEVGRLLERHPALRAVIDEPLGPFDSPVITQVRTRAMLDVLLEAGADINGRSRWWAGGFSLLDCAEPALAAYAIERGATVTVHAAARLGLFDRLKALVSASPDLVHARGGDGQTPLHFASTIEIAGWLIEHGADINARDVDHESTPAQYMVRSRPEICLHLILRGCETDILMAAALGDTKLVTRHLDDDPEAIHMRVSDEYFPMVGGKSGGTIYQWELGWYVSAPQVAKRFGHQEALDLLMSRSPADERLLNACWWGDDTAVRTLLAAEPGLGRALSAAGRRSLAHAARNNDMAAVRLMLLANLPVDTASQHGGTALHWAAWHGNAEAVRLILQRDPPLENAANDFNSTPLGWATHGAENSWHRAAGDYMTTIDLLTRAGAKVN